MKPEREPYIRIIAGILAVAAIPPLGVILFDGSESLTVLKDWQSGLGAFLGAFFGLGAILIGALLNADLNRKRDDRLREQEAKQLAARLHAELLAHVMVSRNLLTTLKKHFDDDSRSVLDKDYEAAKKVWAMEFPVYSAALPKLGILGAELDSDVVRTVQQAKTEIIITLHNLYPGHTRDGDGEKAIAGINTIDTEMRKSAERLRIRAALPADENSVLVTDLAAKQQGAANTSKKSDAPAQSEDTAVSPPTSEPKSVEEEQ